MRVALEQKDSRIVPDMGVRVSFLEAKPEPATQAPKGVLVPAKAIVQHDGQNSIFVVTDGKAHSTPVQPATQNYGDLRLIPASVNPGDSVVVSPPENLHDGSHVQTQTDSP